jgi:hypothetical protein
MRKILFRECGLRPDQRHSRQQVWRDEIPITGVAAIFLHARSDLALRPSMARELACDSANQTPGLEGRGVRGFLKQLSSTPKPM